MSQIDRRQRVTLSPRTLHTLYGISKTFKLTFKNGSPDLGAAIERLADEALETAARIDPPSNWHTQLTRHELDELGRLGYQVKKYRRKPKYENQAPQPVKVIL